MQFLHVDDRRVGYRDSLDHPGRRLDGEMIPWPDLQVMIRERRRGCMAEVVAVVMERTGLIVVVIAGDRQDGKLHAGVAGGRRFGSQIECGIAHMVQPHLHLG
jgi:hypothetical protein